MPTRLNPHTLLSKEAYSEFFPGVQELEQPVGKVVKWCTGEDLKPYPCPEGEDESRYQVQHAYRTPVGQKPIATPVKKDYYPVNRKDWEHVPHDKLRGVTKWCQQGDGRIAPCEEGEEGE